MSGVFLGRIESIVLLDDDNVEVRDAIGNRIKMAPNGARGLHRELGKFLSLANDGKPLPPVTRGDFRNLTARVEALEKGQASMDAAP